MVLPLIREKKRKELILKLSAQQYLDSIDRLLFSKPEDIETVEEEVEEHELGKPNTLIN